MPSGPLALKAEKSAKALLILESVRQLAVSGLNFGFGGFISDGMSVVLPGKVALVRISRLSSGVDAILPSVRFRSPRLNFG